jgi:hypothetical protein
MKNMARNSLVALSALATAAALSFFAPGVAQAAPQCNGETLNGGGWICIDFAPQGYNAILNQDNGSNYDWMDFNLNCDNGRWFGDLGAFVASPGEHSYVFSVGSQGRCHVTIYDRSAGGHASSPSVTR